MNKHPQLTTPRIFILGYGRSGKDTVADMLVAKLNYKVAASSRVMAETFIYDTLKEEYGYTSVDECFNDRHRNQAMRDLWHKLIYEYNGSDLTKLTRLIFKNNNVYVGIRKDVELLAAQEQQLADHYIWVDASSRVPPEAATSMSVTQSMSTYTLDNNGPEEALEAQVDKMIKDLDLVSLRVLEEEVM